MNVFKRAEVWVLAAAVVGGLLWTFLRHPQEATKPKDQAAGPLKIEDVLVRRENQNALLMLRVRLAKDAPANFPLRSPDVRLLAGDTEVPEFIRPFRQREAAPGSTERTGELKYWLSTANMAGDLTLEVSGTKLLVKSRKGFDANKLPDQQVVTLAFPDWSIATP